MSKEKIVMIIDDCQNCTSLEDSCTFALSVHSACKDDFDITLVHIGQTFNNKMNPESNIYLELSSKTLTERAEDKLHINNFSTYHIDELMNIDGQLCGQLGEIQDKLITEFEHMKPNLVMVFGDAISMLAACLAAKKLGINLAHVESGLRTGDFCMQKLIDHFATYYFVTEQNGINNLKNEGIVNNVYFVGENIVKIKNFIHNGYGYTYKNLQHIDEIDDTINPMHYNYKNLDFMYKKNNSENLLVVFHGATRTEDKQPIFYFAYDNSDKYDIISFSNPVFKINKEILLSWYLSMENFDVFGIIKEILEQIKDKYKKVLCHGSSGGGFPSLIIGSHFNFEILISNSQIYLEKYYYYSKLKNFNIKFIEINIEKYFLSKLSLPKIHIYQNMYDEEHYMYHYTPFKQFINNNFSDQHIKFVEFYRDDIGKAIPWSDVEKYKNVDNTKFSELNNLRRNILGSNHSAGFPQNVNKYELILDIFQSND